VVQRNSTLEMGVARAMLQGWPICWFKSLWNAFQRDMCPEAMSRGIADDTRSSELDFGEDGIGRNDGNVFRRSKCDDQWRLSRTNVMCHGGGRLVS
jgi:hypothetical protein